LSPLRSDGSHDGQVGACTSLTVTKGAPKESWKTILGSKGIKRKQHSISLKKSQLTLSEGMTKKGDVVVVGDDNDEVRMRMSQNE
jgi:hypothetical protein